MRLPRPITAVWLPTLACVTALAWAVPARAQSAAPDLTELSLENLVSTEVVSAASFARQISDSASAVSVLTAKDIELLGLRTLAEALDRMRGLAVYSDGRYFYLSSRGYGGPGSFSGRVLLMVDGIPASDNLFDQNFLGLDALIDMSLVDRIEYAPGPGSASYGNNAFVGVINIATRRGRDIDGTELSALAGANRERSGRLTWGRRFQGGSEWLASLTLTNNNGAVSPETGSNPMLQSGRAHQFLLKGRWQDFGLQAMSNQRTVIASIDGFSSTSIDGTQIVALTHDRAWSADWSSSLRLAHGQHRYEGFNASPLASIDNEARGRWTSLDSLLTYQGLRDQRWAFGLRTRHDPYIGSTASGIAYVDPSTGEPVPEGTVFEASSNQVSRRQFGLSAEDEIRLSEQLQLTLGVRVDHREFYGWKTNPRLGLVWWAQPDWQVKLSRGRATRYPSAAEEGFGLRDIARREDIDSSEIATEYRRGALRLQAAAYYYKLSNLPLNEQVDGRGLELEGEWQARGWRLRVSQAWHDGRRKTQPVDFVDDNGNVFSMSGPADKTYAPRSLTKLQGVVPLVGERFSLSLSVQRRSGVIDDFGTSQPGRTVVDAVLVARDASGLWRLRAGVRNLNNADLAYGSALALSSISVIDRRAAWIELSGSFR